MEWETPSFTEIDMSAEIGAYQAEDDRDRPWPPVAEPELSADNAQS
jgi:coenzyme PQQ precursor peptide PqqA